MPSHGKNGSLSVKDQTLTYGWLRIVWLSCPLACLQIKNLSYSMCVAIVFATSCEDFGTSLDGNQHAAIMNHLIKK